MNLDLLLDDVRDAINKEDPDCDRARLVREIERVFDRHRHGSEAPGAATREGCRALRPAADEQPHGPDYGRFREMPEAAAPRDETTWA
ncbi:MAG: hypothetical protein IT208_04155 [Chthonomonadales bacterium]|nr:hypothetical protein [Chthonomonadales bacterium]